IVAVARDGNILQRHGFVYCRSTFTAERDRSLSTADKDRCDHQGKLIDKPGVTERSCYFSTAFNQHALNLSVAQRLQNNAKIACVLRNKVDTFVGKLLSLFSIFGIRNDDSRSVGRHRDNSRLDRYSQSIVQDHAHKRATSFESAAVRQAWIIYNDRV